MNCEKCGNNIGENDMFCPNCGEPVKKENQNLNEGNTFNYDRQVSEPNNYNQPNYGAQNNYGQQPQKNSNSGDIVKIVSGTIILLAVLAAIVFIVYSLISAKNKDEIAKENGNSQVVANTQETGNSPTNTPMPATPISSSYKVSHSGFKLYIPDNLIYQIDSANNTIKVADVENTWLGVMAIHQGSFQQLKQKKDILPSSFMQNFASLNPTVSQAKLETIDGVECVLLEVSMSGTNCLIGFAELNSMYAINFELYNEDNDFNRDYLKNIASIISTAEYTGESSYMKVNKELKMKDINAVFEKAVKSK